MNEVRKLAEKILILSDKQPSPEVVKEVEGLLAEFQAEVENNRKFVFYERHDSDGTITRWSEHFENLVKESKALAYEECAKIVEEKLFSSLGQAEPAEKWLSAQIRALAARHER